MFPKKAGFTLSHIYIDSQALFAILSDIKKSNSNFLEDIFERKDFNYRRSRNQTQRERVWSEIFNYQRFESKDKSLPLHLQKTFDFVMTTDGYKACVRFLKPSNGASSAKKENDINKRKSKFERNNPGVELQELNPSDFDRLVGFWILWSKLFFATMFDSAGGHLQFKTSEYGSRSFLYRYILSGLKTSKEGTMITKHIARKCHPTRDC